KRSGHELHEAAPAHRVNKLAGAVWELPFEPLPKLRRVRQLFEAAPVFLAALGLGTRRRNGFHRWQAEQACEASIFMSLACFSNQSFGRCSCGLQARSVILSAGRRFFAGSRWHSRQKAMLNVLACSTSSILLMFPWQCTQEMPRFT